jgi:hypothetical protein
MSPKTREAKKQPLSNTDNPRMQLIIPFASALAPAIQPTLRSLKLPHLARLMTHLMPDGSPHGTDEYTLTPPHERALATLLGWQGADGCLPWAAWAASQDGIDVGDKAWGQLTPVHWQLGSDHVTLADPRLLHLTAQESHALFEVVRPLFESEGCTLVWGAPCRWYAAHDSLDGLPTASPDRVIGRAIDLWIPKSPQSRLLQRLQNEVQMLLYQQPLNDERVNLGALPINSFWLSGCGRAQPATEAAGLVMADPLRTPALAGNWAAWAEAWQAVDAGPVQAALKQLQKGEPVTLTLCGERFAQRFSARRRNLWSRLNQPVGVPSVLPILESL